MADSPNGPSRYHVAYSERVRQEARNLILRARPLGMAHVVVAAIKEIDARLEIYPQFGQPLCDLKLEPAQLWIGVVPPLVVKYILDHESKVVMVVVPFQPLPSSGLA